jgi:DNA-binding LacI/PurR family transcriptional regulator
MATIGIKQVAATAGVAIGTVSNVLNRPDLVAEPTRLRVLAAIEQLGYVRNESARTLRAGRSRTIALVVLDAANPFFADIASGVESVAHDMGSMVVVCDTGGDVRRERRYLAQLEEQRVQGVLITPVGDDNDALLRLSQRGTPVVLVDSGTLRHKSCCVSVDDVLGGQLAVTHLIEIGFEKIALIGGHDGIRQVMERRRGAAIAAQASAAAHRPVELTTIDTPTLSIAAGREAGRNIAEMSSDDRPTGVFCANDLLALGLMQQLSQAGLRIPHDVGVIGYDDIEFAGAAMVPLTSLRQPRADLGRTAAQLLMAEVSEGADHHHRQVIFEPELVLRESTSASRLRP